MIFPASLKRIRETSAAAPRLLYLHTLAKNVFGPKVIFEPVDTISIEGGYPHFEIHPPNGVKLKDLKDYATQVTTPGVDHLKVDEVVSVSRGGKHFLEVRLSLKQR